MKNRALGKGLAALISENNTIENNNTIAQIDIMSLEPNLFQPRKSFDESLISELADSIMKHGIIQPILASKKPDSDKYQIIAGERRWRAAKISGLIKVPVIIKEHDDTTTAEQALIENIQREDLNPIDEADAYLQLMNKHNYRQEDIAKSLGKSRSHVANMLRIATLPQKVKNYIAQGDLSFSHAKVIAGNDNIEDIAKEIVDKNLNVRQTEHLVKTWNKPLRTSSKATKKKATSENDDDYTSISEALTDKLGLRVTIEPNGSRGKIVIQYNNYLQLDNVVSLLSNTEKDI